MSNHNPEAPWPICLILWFGKSVEATGIYSVWLKDSKLSGLASEEKNKVPGKVGSQAN